MNYRQAAMPQALKNHTMLCIWMDRLFSTRIILNCHILVFLFLLTLPIIAKTTQDPITVNQHDTEEINRIKSAYLYNFLKYIEFPETPIKLQNFFVCVLGKDPFGRALDAMANRQAKGLNVKIERLSSISQVEQCHIIYVSQSQQTDLETTLKLLSNMPIVTVSDIPNFVERGGIIGFTTNEKKISIKINLSNARKAKIQISALLLEIAKIVE